MKRTKYFTSYTSVDLISYDNKKTPSLAKTAGCHMASPRFPLNRDGYGFRAVAVDSSVTTVSRADDQPALLGEITS